MIKKLPGVYVHLPFCTVHCVYCDFPLTTRLSLSPRYYEALLKEIHLNTASGPVDTLYFGGGTPSLAPIEVLSEIVNSFALETGSEVTLEVNPDHIRATALAQWKALGITRISLGVQSLENEVLKLMLREHTPEEAREKLKSAIRTGFDCVNVDLILGYPKQSASTFLQDLESLIKLQPEHFSIYLLELHETTPLYKMVQEGQASLMPEAEQLDSFETAVRILKREGYEHYEVSNFALPGKESRHNLKYWNDVSYLAYGAGACGYVDSTRTRNLPDVLKYIEAMEKGLSPNVEVIHETAETRSRNALIFGLRKTSGINVLEFETSYGCKPRDLFGSSYEEYLADGFLEEAGSHLRLTEKGLLVSNEILSSAL
jgi:oxygen-independent coproporphyrinogen-3 oxidase